MKYNEARDSVTPDTGLAGHFRGKNYEEHDSVVPGELAFELYSLVESNKLGPVQARNIYGKATSKNYRDLDEQMGFNRNIIPGERVATLLEEEVEEEKTEQQIKGIDRWLEFLEDID